MWVDLEDWEVWFLEDTEVEGGLSSERDRETESDRETERTLGFWV